MISDHDWKLRKLAEENVAKHTPPVCANPFTDFLGGSAITYMILFVFMMFANLS